MTDRDIASEVLDCLMAKADERQAANLSRFFKTSPGQYGHGDRFLGIRVPETRAIVKEAKKGMTLTAAIELIHSEWHEVRLAGFLSLIELYRKAKKQKDEDAQKSIVDTYIELIPYGNNWDLVDLVSQYILGDRLLTHPDERGILYRLAESSNLWENRVSIVATFAMIRACSFDDTLRLAEIHMHHPHDLMHKAVGWILRETGKKNEQVLTDYLLPRYKQMPRTMLRYAIERFEEPKRKAFLLGEY